MHELLEAPGPLVLPASLHVLRLETAGSLEVSAEGRAEGLASAAIPVLDMRANKMYCRYLNADGDEFRTYASWPPEEADLPGGFRVLWPRTNRISLRRAGYEGDGSPVTDVDVAEELCRFLGRAPQSYREFRLFPGGGTHTSAIQADWLPTFYAAMQCSAGSFAGLVAAAAAMRQFAPVHGLTVSVACADDSAHLLVVRTETEGQA